MNKVNYNTYKSLILVSLFSLILLLLGSTAAFADTVGPTFSGIYPANDAVLNSGKLTISVNASDPDTVNAGSVVMKVDGTQVRPITAYGWIDEWTDDYTKLDIYYPAALANGLHNVELSVGDGAGHTSTNTWSFTVGQPPKISSLSPANGGSTADLRPVISAVVTSGSGINDGSINMILDGSKVTATYDPISGKISFYPTADLANEATHSVFLSVGDTVGNLAQAQWSFIINTYGDMPMTLDNNTCQQCHPRDVHPMASCTKCHGTNLDQNRPQYPLDDCYKCHFDSSSYPANYHKSGLPVAVAPDHPVRITDSCVECHAKTWGSGIPLYHNVADTANRHITSSQGCEQCHANTLTREHQRRTDSAGNTLTCNTCHLSPDSRVQNAIKDKNSACSACHDLGAGGGHPAHEGGLDSNCQTCHSNSILSEPQFHQQNGCIVCHGADAKDIAKYSISINSTNCFSCHNQGHNVNFVPNVPPDIPQYPGFNWALPSDAYIWAGETWFIADYNSVGAKLVVSDRQPSASGPDVYSWYQENLAANGWVKTSGPDQGSENFVVTYTKDNRMVSVLFYPGETHDPTSEFVGYKMEVLYK